MNYLYIYHRNFIYIKKLSFLFIFMLSGLFLKAQTDSTKISQGGLRSNDVMINPIALVLGVGNLSYERILTDNSGIGISSTFLIDNYVVETTGFFQLTPYYRFYFGKKRAGGFFVEGFAGLVSRDVETYHFNNYPYNGNPYTTTERNTNGGVGVGFGGKWNTKKNIIFEAGIGIGRLFGDIKDSPVFAKGMLGIGKRF